ESTGRLISSYGQPSVQGGEYALGLAEQSAAKTAAELAREMSLPPSTADGVDAVTAGMVGSSQAEQLALAKEQNGLVDEVDRYARREQHAILGLSLSASAAALLGLAGLVGGGRPGRLLLAVAVLALCGAIASGVTAVL